MQTVNIHAAKTHLSRLVDEVASGIVIARYQADRLDATTRDSLEDPGNDVFFSAASSWEIAIKARLGRVEFAYRSADVAHYAVATGFVKLPVTASAAKRVETLPLIHRDPLDRLLLAQAIEGRSGSSPRTPSWSDTPNG